MAERNDLPHPTFRLRVCFEEYLFQILFIIGAYWKRVKIGQKQICEAEDVSNPNRDSIGVLLIPLPYNYVIIVGCVE